MAHENVIPTAATPVPPHRLSFGGIQPEMPVLTTVAPGNAEAYQFKLQLDIEAEARRASTVDEWKFVVANETLKLTDAIQIFVFCFEKPMRLMAISGLTSFERATPLVKEIEQLIKGEFLNTKNSGLTGIRQISFDPQIAEYLSAYPFSKLLWVPFLSRERKLLGGMLLAKGDDWGNHEPVVLQRLADTFSHALSALRIQSGIAQDLARKFKLNKTKIIVAIIGLIAVLLLPVSMTTLAPFEVAPREPTIVASPLDGIIDQILVNPNEQVKKGQKLVLFNDTVFRNRLALADRETSVAKARLKKSGLMAFDEQEGREDIGISMANHSLKIAEQKFASDMLERSTILAQSSGVVLYPDRHSLLGLPVKPGERIMQIANPDQIEFLIDVPSKDAIILRPEARVKIYLDSDPLNAREAIVDYVNYQAKEHPGHGLSFRVVARLIDNARHIPKLGVRGTAQLYGEKVPLAFYLFRRPLSALRQWVGL